MLGCSRKGWLPRVSQVLHQSPGGGLATLVAGETLMRLEGRVGHAKHVREVSHAGGELRAALGKGRKGIQHSSRLVPWYTHLRPPSAPVRAQKKAWVDEAEGGAFNTPLSQGGGGLENRLTKQTTNNA